MSFRSRARPAAQSFDVAQPSWMLGEAGVPPAEENALTRRDARLPHRQDARATVTAAALLLL